MPIVHYDDNEKETLALYVLDALNNGRTIVDGCRQFAKDTGSQRTIGALIFQVNQLREDEKYKFEFSRFPKKIVHRPKRKHDSKKGKETKQTAIKSIEDKEISDIVDSPVSIVANPTENITDMSPIEMTQEQFSIFISKHIRIVDNETAELRRKYELAIEQRDRERERVRELLQDKDALTITMKEVKEDRDALLKAFVRAREYLEGVPPEKEMTYRIKNDEVEMVK